MALRRVMASISAFIAAPRAVTFAEQRDRITVNARRAARSCDALVAESGGGASPPGGTANPMPRRMNRATRRRAHASATGASQLQAPAHAREGGFPHPP